MVYKKIYRTVKNNFFLLVIIGTISSFSACNSKSVSSIEVIKLPSQGWVDSVKHSSDTFYIKAYQGKDFLNAEYYINKKDTVLTQIIKDTANRIRQLITVRKKTRQAFAEYYPNGQLMAKYNLDNFGKFDGLTKFYYPDGRIKNEGTYKNGFRIGNWSNYGTNGNLLLIESYDDNGVIKK